MSRGALRLGDICSGHMKNNEHACYNPRPNIQGSPSHYIDGLPAHRMTDMWNIHGYGDCEPHYGKLASGSSSMYVDGLPMGRIGDIVDCGSYAVTGSSTYFVSD